MPGVSLQPRSKRVIARTLAAACAGTLLLVPAAGWACFPFPSIAISPQAFGPPSMKATVEGTGFAGGPVELRWRSNDGPRIAITQGASFRVDLVVPNEPDGLYQVIARAVARDGSTAGINAVTLFEVARGAPKPAGRFGSVSNAMRPTPAGNQAVLWVGGVALLLVGAFIGGLAVSMARKSPQQARLGADPPAKPEPGGSDPGQAAGER